MILLNPFKSVVKFAINCVNRLVALGLGFVGGWYIFPDSLGNFCF